MKSKDLQNIVISKRQNGDGPIKIFRDLSGGLCLKTVKRLYKMIDQTGTVSTSRSPGCPRIIRTSATIEKVKNRLKGGGRVSARKLSKELKLSRRSIQRILKDDLRYFPYKIIIKLCLTDAHQAERKRFANWVRSNFRKEQTMRILFSDEKLFDIDGVYNFKNDRVWAPSRVEANECGGIKMKRKFPPSGDGLAGRMLERHHTTGNFRGEYTGP